jgi:hypothetical protein
MHKELEWKRVTYGGHFVDLEGIGENLKINIKNECRQN